MHWLNPRCRYGRENIARRPIDDAIDRERGYDKDIE
jgi:hypothetical protein